MKQILLIATGGTLSSTESKTGLTPTPMDQELFTNIPSIPSNVNLTFLQLMSIDSTNMRPENWQHIRSTIMQNYDLYDGFVILHGTDTLAYSAAALSYLIQRSPKPIVFTGSQKPISHPYTDAKINLYQSILYALDEQSCDVSVVFNGKVIAGTRAHKQRTRNFNGFESVNFPLLAFIQDDTIIRHMITPLPSLAEMSTYEKYNPKIIVIKLAPMITAEIFHLLEGHYDAIVLEGFGIGGIPAHDDSFEQAIFKWVNAGKTLAITTQVPEEGCDFTAYQVGSKYSNHPSILVSGNTTTESLVTKLMWILGQTNDRAAIKEMFHKVINYDS